jgi:hypothetical protein
MSERRHYSEEQKAEALGIAVLEGQSSAARVTGIPVTTINQWFNHPRYVNLRNEKRDLVAEMFWSAIQVGLAAVVEGLDGKAPLRDKATALGILYDKYALLTGAATARTESRDLTGTLSDADLIAALRTADPRGGDGGTPPPAADEAA